jgi:hypothetical protein
MMQYLKVFLILYVSRSMTLAFSLSSLKFLNKATRHNHVSAIRESCHKLLDRHVSRPLLLLFFHYESKDISDGVEYDDKNIDLFAEFYDATVSFGSSMSLDQFFLHQNVESMLAQRMVDADDISDVWISLWGCNCKCLTEEEAFQTFCAISNLCIISS